MNLALPLAPGALTSLLEIRRLAQDEPRALRADLAARRAAEHMGAVSEEWDGGLLRRILPLVEHVGRGTFID